MSMFRNSQNRNPKYLYTHNYIHIIRVYIQNVCIWKITFQFDLGRSFQLISLKIHRMVGTIRKLELCSFWTTSA